MSRRRPLIGSPRDCEIMLHFAPTMMGPPSVFDQPRRKYGYSCDTPPNTGSMGTNVGLTSRSIRTVRHDPNSSNRSSRATAAVKPIWFTSVSPWRRSKFARNTLKDQRPPGIVSAAALVGRGAERNDEETLVGLASVAASNTVFNVAIFALFLHARSGAVVAMEPSTGRILAMVSLPSPTSGVLAVIVSRFLEKLSFTELLFSLVMYSARCRAWWAHSRRSDRIRFDTWQPARAGVDQHVASAKRRNRVARIVPIAEGRARRTCGA